MVDTHVVLLAGVTGADVLSCDEDGLTAWRGEASFTGSHASGLIDAAAAAS